MTKEEVLEDLKAKLEVLSHEELSELGILCIVCDPDGVGELLVGKPDSILAAITQAIIDNEDIKFLIETSLQVAEEYKREVLKEEQKEANTIPVHYSKMKS
jgi:hypothetical protein